MTLGGAPLRPMVARTAVGRLAQLDRYLLATEAARFVEGAPTTVLDVGFGASLTTTLELCALLPSDVRVIAVDRDAARVRSAQQELVALNPAPPVTVVQGGFEALASLGPAAVVRALNVLRGYREEDVAQAHALLAAPLVEGGLLVEGSCDDEGHVTAVHWLRKRQGRLAREALVFLTDFSRGAGPWLFRDWLPRDLRRSTRPGTALHDFFEQWGEAFETARDAGVVDARALFAASAKGIARAVRGVTAGEDARGCGWLCWRPLAGVPEAPSRGCCG